MEIAKVYHDVVGKNYARNGPLFAEGDKEENSLSVNLHRGWWKTQPISSVEMTKEEIAAALIVRQAQWDKLQTSEIEREFDLGDKKVTVVPAEMLQAFESVYVDKNNKLIAPKYSAVFGFRRGSALLGAVALRRKLKMGDFNEIPLDTDSNGRVTEKGLPINVEHFASEYDRVETCLLENFGKTQGLSDVSSDWPTIIKGSLELQEFHRTAKGSPIKEADLVRVIGTKGSGEKAFSILLLNTKYPTLKIAENIMNNKTPGSGLDRMELSKLRRNDKTTQDDVAVYLADPKKAKKLAIKAIPAAKLEAFEKETPCRVLREILKAIKTGDTQTLFALYSYAVKIDSAAKGFLDHCAEQVVMRESMVATGESLPEIADEKAPEVAVA